MRAGGESIVMLHGEPTLGYLYRHFIPLLSKTQRVTVPDHMGFGKSETPQKPEYILKTHFENLTAVIEKLGLWNITFVLQDCGGTIVSYYTHLYPRWGKRLYMVNGAIPTAIVGARQLSQQLALTPWLQRIGEGRKIYRQVS